MKNIEIPLKNERDWRYRFFEILPGFISWGIILLPFILSIINPVWAAYFIIMFMLAWLVKAFGFAFRTLQGYGRLERQMRMDWHGYLSDLVDPEQTAKKLSDGQIQIPSWHQKNLKSYLGMENRINPNNVMQAIIIATYNESLEILEPTIQAILESNFDHKRMILMIAYEERGGPVISATTKELIAKYGDRFYHAEAIMHPRDLLGEVVGKGGNITYAGRWLKKYISVKKLNPDEVIVTTLDSDHRVHRNYFSAMTYAYIIDENHKYKSFQPIPMFLNNIWDVPAPMRVLATGNSFWNLIVSARPHLMRNFAAHSQSLETLIDTDFWSVRTIVEDGHQFWRTYFRYDGRHDVTPIYVPIFQDAVLDVTYIKTLKAQFIQLRRWAYGASDVAYVATRGYFIKNKVPKWDLTFKIFRLLENHISWATAPLILAGSAWLPIFINPNAKNEIIAHQLPRIASNINTFIAAGILITVFLSLKMLPPRPPRYKAHKHVFMVLQWVLLPISSIVYGSFAALYSQTRLILGLYLDRFDVTAKAVKK